MNITQEIKNTFRYDPLSGVVYRLMRGGTEKRASFYAKRQGRNRVTFKSQKMYAYRVAWLLHYGQWPSGEIDHINGNPADDRIENLRDSSRSMNSENIRTATSRNVTGFLGVARHKKRFHAMIKLKGKAIYLGSFKTPNAAHDAYLAAKRELHIGCTI